MKIILIFFILCIIFLSTQAQEVDKQLAIKIAENYFDRNVHDSIKARYRLESQNANDAKLKVKKCILKSFNGNPSYFINNMEGGGWVLISADKKTGPVLAYSEFGFYDLDNLPEVITDWMAQFDPIIEKRRQKDTVIVGKAEEWAKYEKEGNKLKSGGIYPNYLIQTTWHQAPPYNDAITQVSTHNDGNIDFGSKCYAGCSSIAISQIINYWGFSEGDKADFEFWHMPNSLFNGSNPSTLQQTEIDATSYMIKVIGTDKLNSTYCDGGGVATTTYYANVPIAIKDFGYTCSELREYNWLTGYNNWLDMLKVEIDNWRPVYYRASDTNGGGHDFICDGYNSANGNLHFNLGYDELDNTLWVDFEDLANAHHDYSDRYTDKFYSGICPILEPSKVLTSIILNNGNNQTWQVYFNLVAKSVTINSGAKSQLIAGTAVTLLPGFWAKPGSGLTVKAYKNYNLDVCPFTYTTESARVADTNLTSISTSSTFAKNDIKIFPNPAYGEFTIETSDLGNGTFQLFDLIGNLISSGSLNSSSTKISLQNISPGSYLIKIGLNSMAYQYKIVHY